MKIVDLKENQKFLEEVAILTQKEWGKASEGQEFNNKIERKIQKIKENLDRKDYCKLLLLEEDKLIGFISIFPTDGEERQDLTPWYATTYVKEEYRGKGYSRILNDAILKEAKNRGFSKLYLKTTLDNYYEKFGAKFIEYLNSAEKLLYFEIF